MFGVMAGVVVLVINDILTFGLMAGIVVIVDDILMFGLMAGVVVLAVGDIRKLVTETIQFGLGSETQSHDIS